MRRIPEQREFIRQDAADAFGVDARVWLFGSRVDDDKRGGDIDLLIQQQIENQETREGRHATPLIRTMRLLDLLERLQGESKIVIESSGDLRPIVQVAHATGVRL